VAKEFAAVDQKINVGMTNLIPGGSFK
jgi:hypothetical protein